MNIVELRGVLESHNSDVVNIFQRHVPELGIRQFDECVLVYILKMLEAQMCCETYQSEDIIYKALQLFFTEFNVFPSEKLMNRGIKAIIDDMIKCNVWQPPKSESSKLVNAVSIGRQYEESMKRATMMKGVGRVTTANTNEDWSWEAKRNSAKDVRKKRREDEKRAMLTEEYEDFLKKRGIASATAVTKLHHKDEGANYSADVRCDGIHIRVGKQILLDETNLTLLNGNKYGLVGRNGSGKTTLLRALAERELEGVSPFVQILHVEQEIVAGNETPLQIILATDVEREQLLREEQELLKQNDDDAANGRLNEVYARLDAIDAHSAESRAASILHGLSFTNEMMSTATKNLSGG